MLFHFSHFGGWLDEDVEEGGLAMCRAVDEVAVMATVGDGKQEVVGHRLIGANAPVLDVAGVDVRLRERARHPPPGDQQLTVTCWLHHDVRQVVRRRACVKKSKLNLGYIIVRSKAWLKA